LNSRRKRKGGLDRPAGLAEQGRQADAQARRRDVIGEFERQRMQAGDLAARPPARRNTVQAMSPATKLKLS
jgi:hypothetical protein